MTPLEYIKTIKLGGGYLWDAKHPTDGVLQDIVYKDFTILQVDEVGSSYCCGVTFSVWFFCFGQFLNIPIREMKEIQQDWYVATGKRAGPVDALVPRNLGVKVLLNEAQPGDFMQLWRNNKSGHSVVYLAHDEMSITYFSTQPSTKGPGTRKEPRVGKNAIMETHIVRANLPGL